MNEEVVEDVLKCRIMQCSVFNCCCRRCRRSLRCLRISLITRLFYYLFVIGINIYVLWLLIEWLTEPRRIKPIVSFENEINPEGFRLYFAGGILMTLTAGVAIIIQSFLIHYMRDDVYRYRANDATEFTRAVTESPFYFAILSVDLCIAFTNLLLSVGLQRVGKLWNRLCAIVGWQYMLVFIFIYCSLYSMGTHFGGKTNTAWSDIFDKTMQKLANICACHKAWQAGFAV